MWWKSKCRTIAEHCMKAVIVLRTSLLQISLFTWNWTVGPTTQSFTKFGAFDRVPQLSQLFCAKLVCIDLKKQGKRCPHCQLSHRVHHIHLYSVVISDLRGFFHVQNWHARPVWRWFCNGSKPASSHWRLKVEIHLQVAFLAREVPRVSSLLRRAFWKHSRFLRKLSSCWFQMMPWSSMPIAAKPQCWPGRSK